MTHDYSAAWDALGAAIGSAQGRNSGSVDDIGHMTTEQQLEVAKIAALLSIAQEISASNPRNYS